MTKNKIILVFIVAAFGVAGLLIFRSYHEPYINPTLEPATPSENPLVIAADPVPENWKTYKNSEWGMEFKHPSDGKIEEYPPNSTDNLIQVNLEGDGYALAINKNHTVVGESGSIKKYPLIIGGQLINAAQIYDDAAGPPPADPNDFQLFSVDFKGDQFFFRVSGNSPQLRQIVNTIISTIAFK